MKTRIASACWVVLCAVAWTNADARTAPLPLLPAADLKGQPSVVGGKVVGVFIWADAAKIHVRWSSDGKPVLFTGSLELSKPPGPIGRINKGAGGWADLYGDRTVMFSATAKDAIDGFDVEVPTGTAVKVDLQIDGKQAEDGQVFAGEKLAQPKSIPFRFTH